jgi:ribonuclease P protein component
VRNTLRRQADFDRVYATGRRHRHALLTVVITPGGDLVLRTAYVVGRRVSRRAVERNRVRRRLREAFRALLPSVRGRHDIVMIAHRSALGASYGDLHAALQRLLRSAGVVQDGAPGVSR